MNYIIFKVTIGKFLKDVKYEILAQIEIEGKQKYAILNPDSPRNKNQCTTVEINHKNIKEVKFY